jgi:CheY-like chemotaxis protein
VQEATTAEDALGALQHGGPFDLLVMDEIFSDMNRSLARGSEAVQQLRQREAADGRPRLMVISCTGNAELGEMRARLLECGADEVWTKPFPNAHDGSMQRSLAKLLPQHVL